MKQFITGATVLLVLTLSGLASASTWTIDAEHSSIGFKVRHLMVSNVKGNFEKFSGTVELDDQNINRSKVSVKIDTASVNTSVPKRDDHLRSADFFDTARFPAMTFVSRKVAEAGKDKLKITGDLTLHGVTREVVLDVDGPGSDIKDPWGGIRRGAAATARISRKDFGLTWNKALETGGVAVGDEVTITLEIEMVRK